MLIEFRIQLDDNGGVNVVQAPVNPNPNSPAPQRLGVAYAAPGPAAANPPAKKGGDVPVDGLGMGGPTGTGASSASGMVFVLGPIVICGSAPGNTGLGGDVPVDGLGMGMPGGNGQEAAPNNNPPAPKAYGLKRRQPKQ